MNMPTAITARWDNGTVYEAELPDGSTVPATALTNLPAPLLAAVQQDNLEAVERTCLESGIRFYLATGQ